MSYKLIASDLDGTLFDSHGEVSAENRLAITSLSGKSTVGTLGASDPEGDAVRYEIVKYPSHGVIAQFDQDAGTFCYVSRDNYTGEDGFYYVAVDEYGNYTESVRVSINVEPDREKLVFSDKDGISDLSAVSVMVGKKIMDAEVRGGTYLFAPEFKIKRAEFVVMAMKTAGKKPSEDVSSLDEISDVKDISDEAKSYLSAALTSGYSSLEINDNGEKCLRPDDIVTKAEAASILSNRC